MLEETISGYAFGLALANESLLESREGKKFTRRRKGAEKRRKAVMVRGGGWMSREQGCGMHGLQSC